MSLLAALLLSLSQPDPSAARVASAIADGRVGERYDGYLDFVVPPDETTRRAVAAVNVKRRALYTQLGSRRKIAPDKIGTYTGCNLMSRIPVGGYYRLSGSDWVQRATSAPVPRPAYCAPSERDAR